MAKKTEIIEATINDLIFDSKNANKHTEKGNRLLEKSLSNLGFGRSILLDKHNNIIAGNSTTENAGAIGLDKVKIIETDGNEIIAVKRTDVDINSKKGRELAIADNQTAKEGINFDLDVINGFGTEFDLDFIKEWEIPYFEDVSEDVEESKEEYQDAVDKSKKELTDEEKDIINNYNYYLYEFSGGRDSSLAILTTISELKLTGNTVEAVFVETGAEFPSVTFHVVDFCKKYEIPLKILHPKQHILQYYLDKGVLPDSIFRDCQHKFINEPILKYSYELAEKGFKVLTIRGGRAKQKTSRSKSGIFQKIDEKTILWNPLHNLSDEEYNLKIKEIPKWIGYEQGFERTACWFCPFQKIAQWEAMEKHYPMLYGCLKKLFTQCAYKEYKGDGCFKNMIKHFENTKKYSEPENR